MGSQNLDNKKLRDELTSICRETAKSLDMERDGSRWKCEVTTVDITDKGVKRYRFYIHDKNSGDEYQAEANVENRENANWKLEAVEDSPRPI